jgi:hypothetical protein
LEWILIVVWLLIINGGLGGQYILNWMGDQPEFTGGRKIDISPGVMTWWREISKLAWALVAVITEVVRSKGMKIFFIDYFINTRTPIRCDGLTQENHFFCFCEYARI